MTEADEKSVREDVLNQLLVLLNTVMKEELSSTEHAAIDEKAPEEEERKPQMSINEDGEDDIEYLHGSLGLVPTE